MEWSIDNEKFRVATIVTCSCSSKKTLLIVGASINQHFDKSPIQNFGHAFLVVQVVQVVQVV